VRALKLRLPASLHRKLADIAERDGVSINQLISSAVAEKMSALMTEEYLAERAKLGSRRKFAAVVAKVPDVEPEERDHLPREPRRRPRVGREQVRRRLRSNFIRSGRPVQIRAPAPPDSGAAGVYAGAGLQ
jgi:hypothetical protein